MAIDGYVDGRAQGPIQIQKHLFGTVWIRRVVSRVECPGLLIDENQTAIRVAPERFDRPARRILTLDPNLPAFNRTEHRSGPRTRVGPEVTSVDADETGLDAVLPRVVPGAVLGQTYRAGPDPKGVDVGTLSRGRVVLQNDPAGAGIVDEQAVVFLADVPRM